MAAEQHETSFWTIPTLHWPPDAFEQNIWSGLDAADSCLAGPAAYCSMTSQEQDVPSAGCVLGHLTTGFLLAQVASESKMAVDVEEYVSSFRTDLCDVLAAWSRGGQVWRHHEDDRRL